MSVLCAVLGLLGLALNILWPLVRGRTPLLIWQGVGCWLFAGHFFLLPTPTITGGWINILAGAQCFVAIPFARWPRFRWIYLLTLPLIGWLVWQGFETAATDRLRWAAVACGAAMGLQCVGRFQLDEIRLRWLILSALPLWSVHNLLAQSWPALGSDVASIVAGLIGLKLALKARREHQEPPVPPAPVTV